MKRRSGQCHLWLMTLTKGRISNDDIVLYSIGGMPVEDVAWGKVCYENAKKLGRDTKLKIWD